MIGQATTAPSLLLRGCAVGAPLVLCLAFALLMRREPASLLAPVLGPWAGVAYGHLDCTMGKQFPVASIALGMAGVLALAGGMRASSRRARTASFVLAAACSVGWSVAALLSIVNTLV